jgi:hypothetical protein
MTIQIVAILTATVFACAIFPRARRVILTIAVLVLWAAIMQGRQQRRREH